MKAVHIDLGLNDIWREIVQDLRLFYHFLCRLYLFYRKEKKENHLMKKGRVEFNDFLKGIVPDNEIIEIQKQIRKETTFFKRFITSENELSINSKN